MQTPRGQTTCKTSLHDVDLSRRSRRRRPHGPRARNARYVCRRDVAAQAAGEARSRARRDERDHPALRRGDGLAVRASSDREDRPRGALGRSDSAVLAEECDARRRRRRLHDRPLRRRVGARRRLRPCGRRALRRERLGARHREDHGHHGARAARDRPRGPALRGRIRATLGEDGGHRRARRARPRAHPDRDRRDADRDRACRRRRHAPRARGVRGRRLARRSRPRRTEALGENRPRAHHVVTTPGRGVRRRERDLRG